ncbi:MAG TPA: hypothetical protein VFE39_01565 [Pseudonocardia sp.]|jgi:hypothetical protein|nr:hypothetical protein [Pseudonocardia sp.]
MEAVPVPYVIEINGHLGATVLAAFPGVTSHRRESHTVLVGLLDHSALHGLLAQVDALGLELLELRRFAPDAGLDREAGLDG